MGRMKSMGFDYALYLADRDGDDPSQLFEQIVNGSIEVPTWFVNKWVDENPVFAAETKAWKQQKRDAKGRFTKGFVSKPDAQLEKDFQDHLEEEEAYDEHIEEQILYEEQIAPYYQYVDVDADLEIGPDEITDFMETAIGDDDFPEKLTEPAFFQFLQKIAESVPLEILEGLNSIMELQHHIGEQMGDREAELSGGRGVFITDILMNIKTGQEAWAAENPSIAAPRDKYTRIRKTSCCCGATIDNPCECMYEGIMDCSSTEPMCPCYQVKKGKDEGYAGTWFISNDAESFMADYDIDISGPYGGRFQGTMKEIKKSEGEKPVGTPMELGKPLDWIPYDEKITAFSRKRAENDDDETNREVNLMRFELVEAEIEVLDFNYLYDLLLHGTPGWANIPDDEVIEEYRQRFER